MLSAKTLHDSVHYGGAVAANELPDPLTFHKAVAAAGKSYGRIIVNYSARGNAEGGTHWCGVGITLNGPSVWFDSFGMSPDAEDIVFRQLEGHDFTTHFYEWLLDAAEVAGLPRTKDSVLYSPHRMQGKKSDVCGEYSSWFVAHGLPGPEKKAWKKILALSTAGARDKQVKRLVGIRPAR